MLSVPNAFFRDWVVQNFEVLIRASVFEMTQTDARVQYVVEKHEARPALKSPAVRKQILPGFSTRDMCLRRLWLAQATNSPMLRVWPSHTIRARCITRSLFMGAWVSAKTHLLNAIGNFLLLHGPVDRKPDLFHNGGGVY